LLFALGATPSNRILTRRNPLRARAHQSRGLRWTRGRNLAVACFRRALARFPRSYVGACAACR
jgi:hypothetical protein